MVKSFRKLKSLRGFTLTDESRAFLGFVSLTPPFDIVWPVNRFVKVIAVDDQVEASLLVGNEFNFVWGVL